MTGEVLSDSTDSVSAASLTSSEEFTFFRKGLEGNRTQRCAGIAYAGTNYVTEPVQLKRELRLQLQRLLLLIQPEVQPWIQPWIQLWVQPSIQRWIQQRAHQRSLGVNYVLRLCDR